MLFSVVRVSYSKKSSDLLRLVPSIKATFGAVALITLVRLKFLEKLTDAKFEEKLTCVLGNDIKNFANFYQSTQNWDFY